MHIICYAGGTCGDLLVAMLDPRNTHIGNSSIKLSNDRIRLKKPHDFADDREKQLYLDHTMTQYLSIPSHDFQYHATQGHSFIGITVTDWPTACWAAQRFRDLHAPNVWKKLKHECGATTIEQYAEILIHFGNLVSSKTDRLITLESILSGAVVEPLIDLTGLQPDRALYQRWLAMQ